MGLRGPGGTWYRFIDVDVGPEPDLRVEHPSDYNERGPEGEQDLLHGFRLSEVTN